MRGFTAATVTAAKSSLPFCAALAITRGHPLLSDFTADALADPALRALSARVRMVADPRMDERHAARDPRKMGGELGWPCQRPPWGQLMAVNVATGEFAWTPAEWQAGSYVVIFTATDAGSPPLADYEQVTITVGVMVKTLHTSTRRICRREPAAPRRRSSQSCVSLTANTATRVTATIRCRKTNCAAT